MCLIIQSQAEIPLTKRFVEDVAKKNNDGWGMMWIQNNQLKTYRSTESKIDHIMEEYNKVKEFAPYLHFRMRTHGHVDISNTHPYYCGHGIYLMHNGVLNMGNADDVSKSDTWHFINKIIRPVLDQAKNPHVMLRTEAFRHMLEESVGHNNRMVIGDRGGFLILNGNNWHKITNPHTGVKDTWVSNTYAWNEHSFRDETAVKTEYKRDKYGKFLPKKWKEGSDSTPRFYVEGLEEYQNPWYLDQMGNVWLKGNHGYIRRYDLDFNDVIEIVEKQEKTQLPLYSTPYTPKLEPEIIDLTPTHKKETIIEWEDKEEEKEAKKITSAIDITTNIQNYQKCYEEQLVKEWMKYSWFDLQNNVHAHPEEAAAVLERLLKDHVPFN